jgi:hypothetical protein
METPCVTPFARSSSRRGLGPTACSNNLCAQARAKPAAEPDDFHVGALGRTRGRHEVNRRLPSALSHDAGGQKHRLLTWGCIQLAVATVKVA